MNEPLSIDKYSEISSILQNCHETDFKLFSDVMRTRIHRKRAQGVVNAMAAGKIQFKDRGITYTATVIRMLKKNLLVSIDTSNGWGRFHPGGQVRVPVTISTPYFPEKAVTV